MGAIILALLLLAGVGLLVRSLILERLARFSRAARSIAAGNVAERVTERGDDVIADDSIDEPLSREVRRLDPDIVIVDTPRPDKTLLEQIATVMRECPRPIILFTRSGDDQVRRDALKRPYLLAVGFMGTARR